MRSEATNRIRVLAVVVALAALAAACSRTPPTGELALDSAPGSLDQGSFEGGEGFESVGGADGQSADAGGFGAGADGTATVPGGTSSGTSGAGTSASGSGTQSAASGVTGQGGGGAAGTNATGGSGAGRTGGKLKFVYSTQLEDCGDDPTTANQGTANEKGLRALSEWVKWFNRAVLKQAGWELEYEVVDDGGPFCPEKAQAAALKIVKQIKPFAVMTTHVQPARGPIVADVATRAGIVHIGDSWQTAKNIRERAPYAWPLFGVAERQLQNLADWMALRIKGTKVQNRSTGIAEDRVYGIVAVDSQEGRQLGAITKRMLDQRGIKPSALYYISGDPGVAAQQSSNMALKLQQDGVNSLVLGVPYPSAINSTIVLSEAMNTQNYLPDIFIGNYGLSLFDSIHNKRVWANAKGTSSMPALVLRWAVYAAPNGKIEIQEEFEEIPENESGYIKVWQERLKNNDQPQDSSVPPAYTTWTQLSMLVTGLLHLDGPLTPQSWAEAVHSARRGGPNRCTVGRFMVRDYIYSAGVDWELGNSGLRSKSTSVYWVNKQTPFGSNGYYESYDNYRFYSDKDWPAKHTRDTGQQGVDIPKQKRIGIRPWTPCSKFPNYPRS